MKRNKLKYFLIATLMCFQSGHASDSSSEEIPNSKFNFPETVDQDWKISEESAKENGYIREEYKCKNQDSLISTIILIIDSNKNSCTAVECRFNSKFKNDFIDLERNLNVKIDESNPIVRFTKDDENLESLHALKDCLEYLQQINAMPKFIIKRIKELTNLDTYNTHIQKVARDINSK